jgi:UDP-N-acetylmuramate dehydrogenase
MNKILENVSLKTYNTFGIDAAARWFASFTTPEELAELLGFTPALPVILGGGSNILLSGDVDGLVLLNEIKGIEEVDEDEAYVYVRAGAGENWAGFVDYCIGRDWAGLENLSLIPGSVGAAPMQNIGAYGVELESVFLELEAWSIEERKVRTFTLNDCEFGYRDSVFKRRYRNQFVILSVTLRLSKTPIFHTSYGAIREELGRMGVKEPGIRAISQAVIAIRRSKLPDPAEIGNAGSFFKNPVIPEAQFRRLQAAFPRIVGYPSGGVEAGGREAGARDGHWSGANGNGNGGANAGADNGGAASGGSGGAVKLAAGWLIEQCGWKGFRQGDAGVHAKQALVLVNYGRASGRELFNLSEDIQASVYKKFGVTLEREVNII